MKRESPLPEARIGKAALAALSAMLLASCSTTSENILSLSPQKTELAAVSATAVPLAAESDPTDPIVDAAAATPYSVIDEGDPALPERIAAVPTLQNLPANATAEAPAPQPVQQVADGSQKPSQAQIDLVVQTRIGPSGPVAENVAAPAAAAVAAAAQEAAPATQPKKRGFFASLFGSPDKTAQGESVAAALPPPAETTATQHAAAAPADSSGSNASPAPAAIAQNMANAKTFIENRPAEAIPQSSYAEPKRGLAASIFSSAQAAPLTSAERASGPLVQLASAQPTQSREYLSTGTLPGVRSDNLFEITRKSGTGDDSDIDLHEDEDGGEQVASAAGLARLAPNGLMTQTDRVDVGCLKPSLLRMIQSVESHYGKKAVVTSGYRNPPANARARGARNSLHMYCAAADIQIPGVGRWELASYLRGMPGRGGVGTYCHTESVHIDVGPERDWNWRCRKRRK